MRLDPVTMEKTIVRTYDYKEISVGNADVQVVLYGDSYYTLCSRYIDGEEVVELVKISVLDGEITRRPTVDLNAKKMPAAWLQSNGYFLLDARRQGRSQRHAPLR